MHRTPVRHYCLKCFTDLPRDKVECPSCGFHNLPSMRQRYWNRAPKIVKVQKLLEALVVLLVLACCYAFYSEKGFIGSYGYWLPAVPVVFGFLLLATVSRLTKHDIYLKCSIVWAIFFLVAGLMMLVWGYWMVFLPSLPLAYAAYATGQLFGEWKRNKIGKPQAA